MINTMSSDKISSDKKNIMALISSLAIWGILFSVLYILRSFFLLMFLTFVFAYIQIGMVNYIQQWIKNRKLRVVVTGVTLLCFLISVMLFLIPSVKRQTEVFISQFGTYIDRVDQEIIQLSYQHTFIKDLIVQLELATVTNGNTIATENAVTTGNTVKGNTITKGSTVGTENTITKGNAITKGTDMSVTSGETTEMLNNSQVETPKNSPVGALFQQVIGLGNETTGISNLNQLLEKFRNISGKIASVGSAFLLALLFSFLIVFDLPNLTKLVTDLEQTRLNFFYTEVAHKIREFAHVLGKALEAQLLIAIINSILTAFGLYFLGIGKYIAFLSVIVFFCSFIPVVGVFVSSVPICLVTLQTSGLKFMILAIVLIVLIHLIEGYFLNPRIYGSYMRINPVLVLIILTIGGKLFHIWGLILGVPVCTYIFAHAIREKPAEQS
ncbi:MAG: AI-2E family transporter [Desulfamplus sp.]|nr:AI-2E family transporter [Desulfamplus sp.]